MKMSTSVLSHQEPSDNMAIPTKLAKELEQLELKPEVTEAEGVINLVFRDYPIPQGYNRANTDLLVRIPLSYPDSGPDMFWTSPELTLANGAAPQCGDQMQEFLGRRWRRFSWHTMWKPNISNLYGYIHFITRRLERAC